MLDRAKSAGSGSKVISTSTVSGSTGLGVSREVRPWGKQNVPPVGVIIWGKGFPRGYQGRSFMRSNIKPTRD